MGSPGDRTKAELSQRMDRLNEALAGHYRATSELGRTEHAHIYRARDLLLRRDVAIKVLAPECARAMGGTDRILHTLEAVSRLAHPHILPVLDYGEAAGHVYCVMPLLEEETLADRLAAGALSRREALRIASEVADALVHAHGHGVAHGAVKPGNVLLAGEHAVLSAFCCASCSDGSRQTSDDIAAVGRLLVAALSDRGAATADSGRAGRPEGALGPESAAAASLPDDLRRIVERCAAGDGAERFADAAALREALVAARRNPEPRGSGSVVWWFLNEMKRRRVIHVGLWYAGASVALVETTGLFQPTLGMPDWGIRFLGSLLLACLPLVLTFAWAVELTPQGMRWTEPEPGARRHGAASRVRRLATIGLIAALAVLASIVAWHFHSGGPGPSVAGLSAGPPTRGTPVLEAPTLAGSDAADERERSERGP